MPANSTKNGTKKWLSVAIVLIPLTKLTLTLQLAYTAYSKR